MAGRRITSVALILLAVGMVSALPAASDSASELEPLPLIEFRIKDQFDKLHTNGSLNNMVVVIISGDRKGHEIMKDWSPVLRDSLAIEIQSYRVRIVDHAHAKGAPFFVKGMIKKSFTKKNKDYVLLDWKGVFDKAYDLTEDRLTIVIFDTGGMRRHQVAVEQFDPATLADLLGIIRGLG